MRKNNLKQNKIKFQKDGGEGRIFSTHNNQQKRSKEKEKEKKKQVYMYLMFAQAGSQNLSLRDLMINYDGPHVDPIFQQFDFSI